MLAWAPTNWCNCCNDLTFWICPVHASAAWDAKIAFPKVEVNLWKKAEVSYPLTLSHGTVNTPTTFCRFLFRKPNQYGPRTFSFPQLFIKRLFLPPNCGLFVDTFR